MRCLFVDDELETETIVEILRSRHPEDDFDLCDTLHLAQDAITSKKCNCLAS